MKDLKKYLGDNKDMKFALDYLNKDMASFREKFNKNQSGGGKKKEVLKRKVLKRKVLKRRF